MLARYYSYCLVLNRCPFETYGGIELPLARRLPSTYPTLLARIFGYLQKYGNLLQELRPKLQTWKILPRHVDRGTCSQLGSTKTDAQSVINCIDRRRSTKLTIPATVDGTTLIVYLCVRHLVVARVHLRQLILVERFRAVRLASTKLTGVRLSVCLSVR